jgi:hypothetical protein
LSTSCQARRSFATETKSSVASETKKSGGGAGLFQRISSFLVGAGLTALVTQYYIFVELKGGNKAMIANHKELEKRVAKLEKK